MEQLKEKLKSKVRDEVAAFSILISICITMIATIGIYTLLQYQQAVEVSSREATAEEQTKFEDMQKVENLESIKDINDIEELQKINEKELEEAKKKEQKSEIIATPKYYIKVNYGAQVVTVYTKDANGKYTKPVKAMVCSTGTYTPTSGVYKTPNRFRWLDMIGDVYAQYCTQIVGDILFHSVPYLEKYNNGSLEYWAYDKLGTRASLGCIRLTCADAKWIYDNCQLGTQVEFYSSSNPGPLGKPSARKISNEPSYIRGWDPTDPASNNPWIKYLKDKENGKQNDKNTANELQNTTANEVTNEITNTIGENVVNELINTVVVNEVEENITNENDVTVNNIHQVETN